MRKQWVVALAFVLPITIFFALLVFFLLRRRRQLRILASSNAAAHPTTKSRNESLQSGIAKLHDSYKAASIKHSLRFHHLQTHLNHHHRPRPVHQEQQVFTWEDYPGLISEAVENGWSRFAFSGTELSSLSTSRRPSEEAETRWEVPSGSSEFMQTIRLNPAPTKTGSSSCCVWMGLPLPGPPLGDLSFPQEAYFEITILYLQQRPRPSPRTSGGAKHTRENSSGKPDRIKLIQGNSGESDASSHGGSSTGISNWSSTLLGRETIFSKKGGDGIISLGLTGGGYPPDQMSGSIGFNSDGSLHLEGKKLVFESEKSNWGAVNRVIGCGFDPRRKKVIYTIDSVLLHVIHCNSDAFKNPLYPTLAANNVDVMLLVNLGQTAFRYAPANAHRTSNPCFLRPAAADDSSASIGDHYDSRELFSLGRIDSHWLDKNGIRKNNNSNSRNSIGNGNVSDFDPDNNGSSNNRGKDDDDSSSIIDIDAESDLFDITISS